MNVGGGQCFFFTLISLFFARYTVLFLYILEGKMNRGEGRDTNGEKNKNAAHYLHKGDRGGHRGRRRFRVLRSDLHCLRVHQKGIYFRMFARPVQNLQEPVQQFKVYTDATCNASGQSVSFCLIHDCSHDNWQYMYRYNVNLDS